ncbi:MAG: adenine phosphoribosyltransferase [Planctomycetes bacterium]|nr:adenine phosphoribosyltransferase [Planctomycetota bacterium]
MDLAKYIRDIPNFPKPGILFKDITPLLADPDAFHAAIHALMNRYEHTAIDSISAAEARGFLFAAPLAYLMKKPLVPLRKPGKLPYQTHKLQYDLEYGQAELHVHVDGFERGAKVLLVDDLLATGGTLEAACKLIEQAGASVIGCAVLVELSFLNGREKLRPHDVFSLIRY